MHHKDSLSPSSDGEAVEPQITSLIPEERKLARRLRIERRQSAARKRLQQQLLEAEEGHKLPIREKTALETQVENSNNEIYDIIDEGIESVTNIRVAGNAFEVQRREEDKHAKEERVKYLEAEAKVAEEKFYEINTRWVEIAKYNDPLHLYEETEKQKDKCKDLLEKKNAVIKRLQEELKIAEMRFLKDQEKQSADINLLVIRINEQIKIMRRVVKNQLSLIEDGIEAERVEVIEVFNKRWEALNRQRERDQVNNLEQKLSSLEEHDQEMEKIMIAHQEKFRETKISLEVDIQMLQREVESVKAICLLNKEKIDYNYQVLKKRDDENLLIKSQQKRRINKLQDIATNLRHKINMMAKMSEAEIKRLRSEVITLYNNITDIEKKAEHFASVNDVKFNQVWKFNKDTANQLLEKILAMDHVIHEQLLGLDWIAPEEVYSQYLSGEAEKDAEDDQQDDEKEIAKEIIGVPEDEDTEQMKTAMLKHILNIVANSSGFLVEERLNELLEPYTIPQRTLVHLHNIFSALSVHDVKEIEILSEVLDPYIECLTCLQESGLSAGETYMEGTKEKSSDADGSKSEVPGILAQLTDMVQQQMSMVHNVVTECSATSKDSPAFLVKQESCSDYSISMDSEGQDDEAQSDEFQAALKKMTEQSLKKIAEQSHTDGKTGETAKPFRFSQISVTKQKEEPKELVKEMGEEKVEEVNKELPLAMTCRNPNHQLTIEPINVLKALKEFVSKLREKDHKDLPMTLNERLLKMQAPKYGTLSKDDVCSFWDGYRSAFPAKNEKLWDALLLGLQKYHSMLQDRHFLNEDVKQLKVQNHDLRRLLASYTIPASAIKDHAMILSHDSMLPPLSMSKEPYLSEKKTFDVKNQL